MNSLKLSLSIFVLGLSANVFAGPVNINTADASTLDAELNGVGPTIAQRIVAFRQANGPFSAPEQLSLVKGVGERTIEKNREFLLVD